MLVDYIIKVPIIDNFVLYYLILYGLNMINSRKNNLHEGYYEIHTNYSCRTQKCSALLLASLGREFAVDH